MAFNSAGTTIRGDLNAMVLEAQSNEKTFIGARVLPPMAVETKSFTYPKVQIAGGAIMDNIATERSAGSSYGKVTRRWTTDTGDCIDRGLEEYVDDTTARDLGRYIDYEATAARLTYNNVALGHEIRAAAAIMNTTDFGAGTNSTVAYTAANLATIDFAADVIAATERVANNGTVANTIVIGSTVWSRLMLSTKLQTWIRGSVTGQLNTPVNAASCAASFADLGIQNVLIGRARYNTAKKGAAASMSTVWGTTYIWVGYVNPNAATPKDGGAGFTFYWNAEGGLFVTETYRDEGARSNVVRVRQNTAEEIVDGTAGTLITTQYS